MNDKELLELAAKAAGIEIAEITPQGGFIIYGKDREKYWWNPLSADGDALRLAVKLGGELRIDLETRCSSFGELYSDLGMFGYFSESDPYAATRRAIVRAGAEMIAPVAPVTRIPKLPQKKICPNCGAKYYGQICNICKTQTNTTPASEPTIY